MLDRDVSGGVKLLRGKLTCLRLLEMSCCSQSWGMIRYCLYTELQGSHYNITKYFAPPRSRFHNACARWGKQLPGMVDLLNKRCKKQGCNKQPSFSGSRGSRALFCKVRRAYRIVSVLSTLHAEIYCPKSWRSSCTWWLLESIAIYVSEV